MDSEAPSIPIHTLEPYTKLDPDTALQAIVTLVWPYSSSAHSNALLLADPDFRLRSRRGQVRVRFTGACADAVARIGLQIGDSVLLGLHGASWTETGDGVISTPGKSVEGELIFSTTLQLRVYGNREGSGQRWRDAVVVAEEQKVPDANCEGGTRENARTVISSANRESISLTTPAPKRKVAVGTLMDEEIHEPIYTSPAFLQMPRITGDNAWLDSTYDPFKDDDPGEESGRPAKRQKVSFGRVRWRHVLSSPSPPPPADEEPSSGATVGNARGSQLQGHGRQIASETSRPLANLPDLERDEEDFVQIQDNTPLNPWSRTSVRFLGSKMLPPSQPEVPLSKSEQKGVMGDWTSSQDEPTTPKLNAVDTSTLPLPSPFPVEGTQFPFAVSSTATTTNTKKLQSSATSALATMESAMQDFAAAAQHRPPDGDGLPDLDVSNLEKPSPSQRKDDAHTEASPAADERTTEELETNSSVEHGQYGEDHLGEMYESDIEELIEIPDGSESLQSQSVSDYGNKEDIENTKSLHHVGEAQSSPAISRRNGPLEIETDSTRLGAAALNPAGVLTTPTRDGFSKAGTSFGVDGTSSSPPSQHLTPKSEREKTMARTLSSLFGFKKSEELSPEQGTFDDTAVVDLDSPTHTLPYSAEIPLGSQDIDDKSHGRVLETDRHLQSLRDPHAVTARSPSSLAETDRFASQPVSQAIMQGSPQAALQPLQTSTDPIGAATESYENTTQPFGTTPELFSTAPEPKNPAGTGMLAGDVDSDIREQSSYQQMEVQAFSGGSTENGSHERSVSGFAQLNGSGQHLPSVNYEREDVEEQKSVSFVEEGYGMIPTKVNTPANLAKDELQEFGFMNEDDQEEGNRNGPLAVSSGRLRNDSMPPEMGRPELILPFNGTAVEPNPEAIEGSTQDKVATNEENTHDTQFAGTERQTNATMLPLQEQTKPAVEVLNSSGADQASLQGGHAATTDRGSSVDSEINELVPLSSEGHSDTVRYPELERGKTSEENTRDKTEKLLPANSETREDDGRADPGEPHFLHANIREGDHSMPSSMPLEHCLSPKIKIDSSLYPSLPLSPRNTQSVEYNWVLENSESANLESKQPLNTLPPTPQLTQHASSSQVQDLAYFSTRSTTNVSQPTSTQIDGQKMIVGIPAQPDHLDKSIAEHSPIAATLDGQMEVNPSVRIEADVPLSSSIPTVGKEAEDVSDAREMSVTAAESQRQLRDELESSTDLVATRTGDSKESTNPVDAKSKTPTQKARNQRLSFVPDVLKEWFSPRRSSRLAKGEPDLEQKIQPVEDDKTYVDVVEEGMTLRNGHRLGMDNGHHKDAASGFSTRLGYFVPLANISQLVNSASQQSSNRIIDVFAVVTDKTKEAKRAKAGPKDFFTLLRVTDMSLEPESSIRIEVFRPWMATLPIAHVGDIILLRGFVVKSRRRLPYLLSTDASAWCVWRYEERDDAGDSSMEKPAWAQRRAAAEAGTVREEVKGPPLEFGLEEKEHAQRLRDWWVTLRNRSGK